MSSYMSNTVTTPISSTITGASTGLGILTAAGVAGASLWWAAPIALGLGFIATLGQQSQLHDQIEAAKAQRESYNEQRNQLISGAQREITTFRNTFDSTYGEGMYDTYDELFSRILNLPSGTQTVSDLLSSLSIENVAGTITTKTENMLSDAALSGTISASDVNSTYLEYMQSQIRDAETAIGLQFQSQTIRENAILRDYYDSIDQYNLAVAEELSNAFLQQRQNNVSLASSMGEAETAQAGSGIRQIGSGTNLTGLQQFQHDMSNMAYYSMLGFTLRQYEGQMNTLNNGLVEQVSIIRNENAQMTEQFTNDFFNSMNAHYGQLNEYYYNISGYEGAIDELSDNINEMEDAYWLRWF